MNNKPYDFVLFESTRARNHHKDMEMIAHMLIESGMKVAIAEVYVEAERCKDTSIPHIKFEKKFQEKFIEVEDGYSPLSRFAKNRVIMHRYGEYLKYVAKQLNSMTKNIYAGSQENGHPFSWVKFVDPDIKIYLWGLRSFRMYEYKLKPFSLSGIHSYFNTKYYWYPNMYYFVSDEMIKAEYLKLGVEEKHLIIRPERTTPELHPVVQKSHNDDFNLLSIGMLRPDKRIEVVIDAVKQINNPSINYIIAGKTSDREAYEPVIEEAMEGTKNIVRKNYRLSNDEFNSLMSNADFLVLCDVQQASNVTNGTMNEALLLGKPIIAPNYNPYKYFVEKYGVGILFDPTDRKSLVSAILSAKEKGAYSFNNNILEYQKTLLYSKVRDQFVNELKNKI